MAVSTQPVKPAESNLAQDHGVIPRLENGDRLTRAEFERRYDAMPELNKAELIEGEVYMPCLLYTSPSPRDRTRSRMPSSA